MFHDLSSGLLYWACMPPTFFEAATGKENSHGVLWPCVRIRYSGGKG